MKTFDEAQADCRKLDAGIWSMLRQMARARLLENWPEDEGLGTSDISCEAIAMVQRMDFEAPGYPVESQDLMRELVERGLAVPDPDQVKANEKTLEERRFAQEKPHSWNEE